MKIVPAKSRRNDSRQLSLLFTALISSSQKGQHHNATKANDKAPTQIALEHGIHGCPGFHAAKQDPARLLVVNHS
ncbi:MAG: hypothetical protein WEC15_06580 [Flavobacteriales bacterium]